MKKILYKLADAISFVYGYGIMLSLFVGGISFFAYVLAIIIGGETATALCDFIYNGVYPIMVKCTSCLVLLGLVKMYIKGEYALARKG